jgi:hypothetical protein
MDARVGSCPQQPTRAFAAVGERYLPSLNSVLHGGNQLQGDLMASCGHPSTADELAFFQLLV